MVLLPSGKINKEGMDLKMEGLIWEKDGSGDVKIAVSALKQKEQDSNSS